jgi:hypothetical protein
MTEETAQRIELGLLRERMVNAQVMAKIDRRHGDCTLDQIKEWEDQAYARWRETYPALSQMFTPVVAL